MDELISTWLTTKDNYDRNHGPIQHKDGEDYEITIDGLVARPCKLSVQDLQNKFPQHKIACALSCAGNRRHTMRTRIKEVSGIDWFDGAVMNCVWEGPRLADVLRDWAGCSEISQAQKEKQKHVQFASYGTETQDDKWYGGSIPLERAMNPEMDVILALKVCRPKLSLPMLTMRQMNGKPLSPRHGYPVRVIVPGVLGARSVKWLDTITIAENESENVYQRRDYKVLPPNVLDMKSAQQWWDKIPSMLVCTVLKNPEVSAYDR